MRKKILLVLRYAGFLALGLVLAWLTIRSINADQWMQIKLALTHARYALLVPIVLLYLLSHYSRAVRWKIMIRPLGYKPVTMKVFFSVLIGYLANLAIPRLGEVLRCTILGRHEKIPVEQLLGTIIVERAFDVLCLVVVFGISFLMQASAISDMVLRKLREGNGGHHLGLWIILAVLAGVLLGCGLLWRYRTSRISRWIGGLVVGLWAGFSRVRYMDKKGWFLFHTVLIWTLYYACTRLGIYAIREMDGLGAKETFSVLAVGSVAMVITPGGLGAYPAMVMSTLIFYGVTDGIAKAGGLLLWIVPTLVIVVGGVLSFLGLASKAKPSKNEELPTYGS
jgi:glycosyltransferase 2 family protein